MKLLVDEYGEVIGRYESQKDALDRLSFVSEHEDEDVRYGVVELEEADE